MRRRKSFGDRCLRFQAYQLGVVLNDARDSSPDPLPTSSLAYVSTAITTLQLLLLPNLIKDPLSPLA